MTEKHKIHCLHICGHLDAMMEEAANKKFEERQQAIKPPIQCSTAEDSGQLHEIYKDRVQGTEVYIYNTETMCPIQLEVPTYKTKVTLGDPSVQKKELMAELMLSIEHAKLAHSMMLLHAKQEEYGVKRRPSTLSHMHHDDSDSEGEVEEDEVEGEVEDNRRDQSEPVDRESAGEIDASDLFLHERSHTPALVVIAASTTEQEEPGSSTKQGEPETTTEQGEPVTSTEHEVVEKNGDADTNA